ncbi:hypothetical protein LNTAR_11666 [Lentisphaera araneosa HTCC2155]|uniref:DUF1559 domain-containing protein n=1 Tax=Lentisphaera araneosa HTCC2155 TaxID=313628 RepID=A6DJD4_9BACT|nr:type II secretion system protein [Lentisphaera araneosa]EDM28008.1 hypothetical protein LNTAR_11666 [Lentisphaera araneosa HTCC2155]
MKDKKFSLIELLVVVAIIGILASFLLPTLKKARDSARRASCMSQEKQIGIAFAMYHGDNDGYYPVYGSPTDNISWDDQLGDYDGRKLTQVQKELQEINDNQNINNSLYSCPGSIQQRNGLPLKSYSIGQDYGDIGGSPAVRGTAGWNGTDPWSLNASQIVDANDFTVMMEVHNTQNIMGFSRATGVGRHSMGHVTSSYSPVNLPGDGNVKGGISGFYVHSPTQLKMNFLYGDGHVEFKSPAATVGTWRDNFYSGTWTGWWEMQDSDDTQWNALD